MPGRLSDGPHARLHRRERVRRCGGLRDECEMHQRPGLVQVHLPAGLRRPRTNSLRKSVTAKAQLMLTLLIACRILVRTLDRFTINNYSPCH